MSTTKEFRLDVTALFYPEDLTPPGQTPMNLLEIKKGILEQCKKQGLAIDPNSFGLTEHIFDDDSAETWIYASELDDAPKFWEAVIEAGKVFYPDLTGEFEIINSDLWIEEALLMRGQ